MSIAHTKRHRIFAAKSYSHYSASGRACKSIAQLPPATPTCTKKQYKQLCLINAVCLQFNTNNTYSACSIAANLSNRHRRYLSNDSKQQQSTMGKRQGIKTAMTTKTYVSYYLSKNTHVYQTISNPRIFTTLTKPKQLFLLTLQRASSSLCSPKATTKQSGKMASFPRWAWPYT